MKTLKLDRPQRDRYTAIYKRVSTKAQDTKSQEPDLERHADSRDDIVQWYSDKHTGKTMDRPGWKQLEEDYRSGRIGTIVVWRLDRLGRTAAGLTTLFEELQRLNVNLVSIRDGIDLSTPSGRLMANVIASMAQYENEVRAERIQAGQAVARKKGKTWGGSKPGQRRKVTPQMIRQIRGLLRKGMNKTQISRATGLSRPTVRSVVREIESKTTS